MVNRSIIQARMDWQNVLSIGAGASDFEVNLFQMWTELNTRPSVIRQGFAVSATKFWSFINDKVEVNEDNIVESTDCVLNENQQVIENKYYVIKISSHAYLTCTEFIPDFDEAEYDGPDMVERKIGDINLYYVRTPELHEEMTLLSRYLNAMRVTELAEKTYAVLTPGLGGYREQYSVPVADEIDYSLHFDAAVLSQYEDDLPSIKNAVNGIVLITGPEGTGPDVLVRKLINDLCEDGKSVISIPDFLHTELSVDALAKYMPRAKGCVIVAENASELLASSGGKALLSYLRNGDDLIEGYDLLMVFTGDNDLDLGDYKAHVMSHIKLDKIPAETANSLAASLEIDASFTEPVNISEVYDKLPEETAPRRKKMGFDTSAR